MARTKRNIEKKSIVLELSSSSSEDSSEADKDSDANDEEKSDWVNPVAFERDVAVGGNRESPSVAAIEVGVDNTPPAVGTVMTQAHLDMINQLLSQNRESGKDKCEETNGDDRKPAAKKKNKHRSKNHKVLNETNHPDNTEDSKENEEETDCDDRKPAAKKKNKHRSKNHKVLNEPDHLDNTEDSKENEEETDCDDRKPAANKNKKHRFKNKVDNADRNTVAKKKRKNAPETARRMVPRMTLTKGQLRKKKEETHVMLRMPVNTI
jgi:hypothetical protein